MVLDSSIPSLVSVLSNNSERDFTAVTFVSGLLYIQNGDSLADLSGFDNLVHVDSLVLALLGDSLTDISGFSSLHSASRLYITRNNVSTPPTLQLLLG